MSVYFISDLHLSEQRADITQTLLTFLNQLPKHTESLYILGDFLEYWVGDDQPADWLLPVKNALCLISKTICPIYFIHGNRDFLVGSKFAKECGMNLLAEPSLINLYGQNVLILHGDSLCTQDERYQNYRKWVRKPWLQWLFSLLPLVTRQAIFGAGRKKSKLKQQNMANMDILDATPSAVSEIMDDYQVDLLIHGHTHRPAIHLNARSQNRGTRIVLGDWYEQGSILEVDKDGYLLYNLQFTTQN